MTKFEEIDKLLEQNDGYLFSKDVEKAGIYRTYLTSYVKERRLERVSKGIYIHGRMNCTFSNFVIQKLFSPEKLRCIFMK
jgi:hypothetical protein